MKKRGLVIGLLIMLALVTSGFTYAFWSNVALSDDAPGTVTIGEGRQALVTVDLDSTLPTGSTLVPVGEADNSISVNPVESIVFTFTVEYDDNMFAGQSADITLDVTNISNATAATYLLFTFTGGDVQSITEGTPLTITLTVTLTEPANQADYLAIINAAITFDVTFVVDELNV